MTSLKVLAAILGAWAVLSAVSRLDAAPNRENAVGTYQIACGGSYTIICKVIDTRTGDVVGGE